MVDRQPGQPRNIEAIEQYLRGYLQNYLKQTLYNCNSTVFEVLEQSGHTVSRIT